MKKWTKEQIADIKKKHGKVFLFESGDKSCLLKLVGRNELSYATAEATSIAKNNTPSFDANKFNEAILRCAWVDGDEEIKTEDKYFLGITEELQVLIEKSTFKVKEL